MPIWPNLCHNLSFFQFIKTNAHCKTILINMAKRKRKSKHLMNFPLYLLFSTTIMIQLYLQMTKDSYLFGILKMVHWFLNSMQLVLTNQRSQVVVLILPNVVWYLHRRAEKSKFGIFLTDNALIIFKDYTEWVNKLNGNNKLMKK